MNTDCTAERFKFQASGRREIVAGFNGGRISSDGGLTLLREVPRQRGIIARTAACFHDFRDQNQVEHTTEQLLRQRIFGICAGYEDLCDHDELRKDALWASVVGKKDPTGESRSRRRDHGKPLASKSTLNRLEWGTIEQADEDPCQRIVADTSKMEDLLVDLFLEKFESAPRHIVLDLDATDSPLHGGQEGRFFHGYYNCYCYLPLYIFCGRHVICIRLRRSNIDASAGSAEELERVIGRIRAKWPKVEILIRADSGFAREALMSWCEENKVYYVLGLARNRRLESRMDDVFERLEDLCARTEKPGRLFKDFKYSTLESWSSQRRVIGKAEITWQGPNPRFVVTNLSKRLYEKIHCARGEAENRIKEQQLDLFATRTSGHLMRVNQVRLIFSALAYTLLEELRRLALARTPLERARCETIRLVLLKIGARIRVTARKVWVHLASAHPVRPIFSEACNVLAAAAAAAAKIFQSSVRARVDPDRRSWKLPEILKSRHLTFCRDPKINLFADKTSSHRRHDEKIKTWCRSECSQAAERSTF